MPFTNTYANNILNWMFSKRELTYLANVYIGLCANNPEETNGTINELTGGGYSRVLLAQFDNEYPGSMNTANNRAVINGKQINWTKATLDWTRVNGFFLSTSPSVGETSSIFFYGALDLTDEQKAAGGLLVEAGAVCLFDPMTFKIEFPAMDVSI